MTTINTRNVWFVTLPDQSIVRQQVEAHALDIRDGCLIFTVDGFPVRAFAPDSWAEVEKHDFGSPS